MISYGANIISKNINRLTKINFEKILYLRNWEIIEDENKKKENKIKK
jgi:hypothetical protein